MIVNAAHNDGKLHLKAGRYLIEHDLVVVLYNDDTGIHDSPLNACVFEKDGNVNRSNWQYGESIPEREYFYDPTNGTFSKGIIFAHFIYDDKVDKFLLVNSVD